MENTFLSALKESNNYKLTENYGLALFSTMNKVLDLFAFGAAYRKRNDSDCILLFKNAFEQDPNLALKCLFYIRDVRGGQGERRFFRVCFRWLVENYPEIAFKNLVYLPEYGRFDDVLYTCIDTSLEEKAFLLIQKQLTNDIVSETPSLLAKWLPSCNASSKKTRQVGNKLRNFLGLTQKEYRVILSVLRERINVLEKTMSANKWDDIDFSKIPSKAGLKYKNAFATREETAERYAEFVESTSNKVNAGTLYPYEIVDKALSNVYDYYRREDDPSSIVERQMINKYWDNLSDYFNGKQSNMLCVIDTSGSMRDTQASAPINVAISLGMYAAERAGGLFKDHYISFASRPQLIKVEGTDFVDKVERIYRTNLCDNTDLAAVFDLLLAIADRPDTKEGDIPQNIVVISDMEIDCQSDWDETTTMTEMEKIRKKWFNHGHKMPKLIYWNVDSRGNTILEKGEGVSFVSGMSPSIFKHIITGKTGYDLMIETLIDSGRYDVIHA